MTVRCKSKNKNTEITHEIGYACDYVKILTAREMFEELGYECDVGCDGILYSQYINLNNGDVANCQIHFDKVDKIIEKDVSQAGFSMKHYNSRIKFEELKAINKQVEELGWNK